jgi:hypothetical protein
MLHGHFMSAFYEGMCHVLEKNGEPIGVLKVRVVKNQGFHKARNNNAGCL